MRRALEEKRNRHLQNLGDLLQPAGADAVGSLFVFLNPLKRKVEGVAELSGSCQHHLTHAHARTDVLAIDCAFWHRFLLPPILREVVTSERAKAMREFSVIGKLSVNKLSISAVFP
jgi:hypothetical protein